MLKTLQIIALIQGLFVLSVLFINRKDYKKTTFWLLFGSLFSVLLYILGDDDNNIFIQDADWFLFDSSLFITFLFLFFRYYKSGKDKFDKVDYLFSDWLNKNLNEMDISKMINGNILMKN